MPYNIIYKTTLINVLKKSKYALKYQICGQISIDRLIDTKKSCRCNIFLHSTLKQQKHNLQF